MPESRPTIDPRVRSVVGRLLWLIAVPSLVLIVYALLGGAIVTATGGEPMLGTAVLGLVVVTVVSLVRSRWPHWVTYRPSVGPLQRPARYLGLVLLTLALAFLAGQCLALSLYAAFGSAGFDEATRTHKDAVPGIALLLVLVIAPLSEESLFRGLIYPLLRRRVGVLVAVLTTSAVFAMMHTNIVQFAAALPMSVLAALIYERTRTLWPVVLTHMAFNLCAMLLPPTWLALIASPVIAVLLMGAFATCAWLLWTHTGRIMDDA